MYVDPRANFKAFFVLRPLVGLRGRNGGLSLAIGLRASCAMGTKVVSLKSTLSTFWVVLVVWGGFDDLADWFAYIYMQCRFRWLVGFPIYMRGRLPVLLGD